ncbi:MAG: serine/threonine protein kinase [Deltaproteobacteria bacterium]|nr:serine/threonine protein kinase [Deltaproteobacteria bacterium]
MGQVVGGRYWLREHLGRGQMGDVFRARHTKVPRQFAIKVLHPELVRDPKLCARFEREAAVAGRLRHRNVISVIDFGETAHSRYIVMELALGPSLAQLIEQGPVDPARAIRIAMQVCDGLHHAHEADLIHRDLKPENVILELENDEEVAKIVDFGLAIVRDGAGEGNTRLTTRGMVLGTPHYLAPESAMGKPIDRRADLFALGVMLFEMLTGQMPFAGDGVQVATANVGARTPTMASRAPDVVVDPLLEAVVRRLLEKRPQDRFATALEVHDVLRLIGCDRRAAAAVLGIELAIDAAPHAPGPETQIATDEVAPLSERGRGRSAVWATVLVMLLFAGIAGVALRSRTAADPIAVVLAETAHDDVPAAVAAPEAAPDPVTAARPVVTPRRADPVSAPVAVAAPVTPATPIVEARPVQPDSLLQLYASVGRTLKRISDRRDLSADDLWQRYRRIRIQHAITSSATRADAMNVLTAIEREVEARFLSPLL